jgi:hypothetical protein
MEQTIKKYMNTYKVYYIYSKCTVLIKTITIKIKIKILKQSLFHLQAIFIF